MGTAYGSSVTFVTTVSGGDDGGGGDGGHTDAPGYSDLIASAITSYSPIPAIVGSTTTFSATISNLGDTATPNGTTITHLLQIGTGIDANNVTVTNSKTTQTGRIYAIGSAGSTVNISISYKFQTAGDNIWARVCADKSSGSDAYGVIDEGPNNVNEGNNCKAWQAVPVPAPTNGVWSAWSACSATCGTGTQTRTCDGVANGGVGCAADPDGTTDTRACAPALPACVEGDSVTPACASKYPLCANSTGPATNLKSSGSKWTWTCNGTNGSKVDCTQLKRVPTATEI